MPKSNELSLYSNFNKIGGDYKNARKEYLKREKVAQEYIDIETKSEKQELDKALKKYNDKMSKVIKSDKFKKIENEAKEYSNEMSKNLIKAKDTFFKIKDDIYKKDWDDKKKQKKVEELYEYILGKLYTKEEIEEFKKLTSMLMIVN